MQNKIFTFISLSTDGSSSIAHDRQGDTSGSAARQTQQPESSIIFSSTRCSPPWPHHHRRSPPVSPRVTREWLVLQHLVNCETEGRIPNRQNTSYQLLPFPHIEFLNTAGQETNIGYNYTCLDYFLL